jgi:DNA-binding MarR family transcriptional regulator
MAKDDSKEITQLLQNLLIVELWRGGLSQGEIGKRLCVAKASVNKILKGVNREILTRANNKE